LLPLGRRWGPEHVASTELPEPAPQTLEALLLLVKLRWRVLADRLLVIELRLILVALADELEPLLLARLRVQRLEPSGVAGLGVKREQLAVGAFDQFSDAFEDGAGVKGTETSDRARDQAGRLPSETPVS
jgi:hypothetical protein